MATLADASIGVRTGAASGPFVLDVDVQHGGGGTLAELDRQHGKLPRPQVLTGGGGNHHRFRHSGGEVKNTVGKLGAGLDTRVDGGYVVAPPSVHASGRPYKLLRGLDELEPAPAWLLEPDNNGKKPAAAGGAPIAAGGGNAELASLVRGASGAKATPKPSSWPRSRPGTNAASRRSDAHKRAARGRPQGDRANDSPDPRRPRAGAAGEPPGRRQR